MKKLLLILLCLPMIGFGQTDDVLKRQTDIDNINYRMEKHHKQYFSGVTASVAGLIFSSLGALVSVNPLVIMGGAVMLVGNIVMIDSHKWFKNIDVTADRIKKKTKQLNKSFKSGEINREEYDDAIKELNNLKQ